MNAALRGILGARAWRSRVPAALWRRLPVVGSFHVDVPTSDGFVYAGRGEPLSKALFWRGIHGFEPGTADIFMALAKEAEVFLDVGAYSGYYTLLGLAVNPQLEVHAFEPVPALMQWLREHVEANSFTSNVNLVARAVSDGDAEESSFYLVDDERMPSSSLVAGYGGTARTEVRVSTCSVDGYAADVSTKRVQLIKIDAEGAEARVLQGAIDTLTHSRPFVVCEILDPESSEPIAALCRRASYSLGRIGSSGMTPMEAPQIDPTRLERNFLLWPRERSGDVSRFFR